MTPSLRYKCSRWILVAALLASIYCAGRGGLLIYALHSVGEPGVFEPPSAEEVSRRASPYQANTRETDGMFRIVQQQHQELTLMYSTLEASSRLNRGVAVGGTSAFALLACLVALALALGPWVDEPPIARDES